MLCVIVSKRLAAMSIPAEDSAPTVSILPRNLPICLVRAKLLQKRECALPWWVFWQLRLIHEENPQEVASISSVTPPKCWEILYKTSEGIWIDWKKACQSCASEFSETTATSSAADGWLSFNFLWLGPGPSTRNNVSRTCRKEGTASWN